jgi:hypothetical protein
MSTDQASRGRVRQAAFRRTWAGHEIDPDHIAKVEIAVCVNAICRAWPPFLAETGGGRTRTPRYGGKTCAERARSTTSQETVSKHT